VSFYSLTTGVTNKESPQDNGGAEYGKMDTFDLCRAGRLVRHDFPNGNERQTQCRNGDWQFPGDNV
jgi:hypothetical protein